jgi:regulatory protein
VKRERLSLKARALAWLAQREHSRVELRRKLLRVARAEARERALAQEGEAPGGSQAEDSCAADPAVCVDRLLDWLQAHRYLSDARFVESRVNARAARYGNLRIRQELAQHGAEPDAETLAQLRGSELERARAVWQRKFGAPADDAAGRARQMRFLAQRGFSADTVRRVVQGGDDEPA